MAVTLLRLLVGLLSVLPGVWPVTSAPDPLFNGREFPVLGQVDYGSAHHDYPATDMFARCGSPAVAPFGGVLLEVGRQDRWDATTDRGGQRGGRFFSLRGDDGVRYYGSHLRRVRPGLRRGTRVVAGERLGRVGNSGDARGIACHLHFGLSAVCRGQGDWWVRRGVVSPYRFLRAWEAGADRSPRHAVRGWRRHHDCSQRPGQRPHQRR